MTDLLEKGIDFFNRGLYFEAHEAWEDLWRETQGEERSFYQGLVQVAVGLHHLGQGNRRGGERVLRRGLERLEAYPDTYLGLNNARFKTELKAALEGTADLPIRIGRE